MLAQGEVHVWEIALEEALARSLNLGSLLSEDEWERAARFYFSADRERWILCRGALRNILARYTGIPPKGLAFEVNAYGKPQLAGFIQPPPLHFNLTHTQRRALLAIACHEVGVDAEDMSRDLAWPALASEILTDQELRKFGRYPKHAQRQLFFELWTRKEAYIKGRGLGLSLPLKAFCVPLTEAAGRVRVEAAWDDGRPWRLFALPTHTPHVAALAYAERLSSLQRFELIDR